MTAAALTIRPVALSSPKLKARLAALFYLLTIVTGIIAQGFISERLVVSGDAAATAANIVGNESLFRLGFTIYLSEMAAQIAMTVLFYELLKPVNKSVALLSAVFGLVGCTIKTLARLFYVAPLIVLGGASYLSVFDADQLKSLALLFLDVNDRAAAMALAFFGFQGVLEGYLILKSTFLPRFLGVFSLVGGLGWLTFLVPPLGYQLFLIVAGFALLGSIATILWLFIVGVDENRWKEQSIAAARSV